MYRCIELAKLSVRNVAPNPMVGAVLVNQERIIGEGYHEKYGKSHAEVNCINSVSEEDKNLISFSTLYVSLEPCVHFGKTPPCADLIIKKNIPKVIIGCKDVFTKVDGKGIEKMRQAGVEVIIDVLNEECKMLNKRFFTFHEKKRSYIILKWAQSADGKIAGTDNERLLISNEFSDRIVHKWRSEEAAILIGTNTAKQDNPSLTNRMWAGNSPIRLVIDMNLGLPLSLNIFDGSIKTFVFNGIENKEFNNILFLKIRRDENVIMQILDSCYDNNIQSVLVEGGAKLLQSFIDKDIWDEARIIKNEKLKVGKGLNAPQLINGKSTKSETFFDDRIDYLFHKNFTV